MTSNPDHAKADIRTRMRATLAALSPDERHAASLEACSRLIHLDAFKHASIVMLYMPLASEVDTTSAAIRSFQLGKTVCVPKVDWKRRDMGAVEANSFDDHFMHVDEHGLRSPRHGRPVVPGSIDVVVVPGLAFDVQGHRLGRGGGYYDRFLARLRRTAITIGLAFDMQIIDEVPVTQRDVSVHLVVTNRRVTGARSTRA